MLGIPLSSLPHLPRSNHLDIHINIRLIFTGFKLMDRLKTTQREMMDFRISQHSPDMCSILMPNQKSKVKQGPIMYYGTKRKIPNMNFEM